MAETAINDNSGFVAATTRPVDIHVPMTNPHKATINQGHACLIGYPYMPTYRPALGTVKHHKKKKK